MHMSLHFVVFARMLEHIQLSIYLPIYIYTYKRMYIYIYIVLMYASVCGRWRDGWNVCKERRAGFAHIVCVCRRGARGFEIV
jgi:hypothetical protein